jgi:hypothetical protein
MRLVVFNHVLMKKVPLVDVLMVQRLKTGCLLLLLTICPVTAIMAAIDEPYSQLGSINGDNR